MEREAAETLLGELLALAETLGVEVEVGDPPGDGGVVRLAGKTRVLLNVSSPLTHQVDLMAEALASEELGDQFLKPRLRALLESARD
jgi:hypothetical protein